jgi:hypothetical protein
MNGLALKPEDFENIGVGYGSNQSDVDEFDIIFCKFRLRLFT